MEKTFKLDQKELTAYGQLEQERTQALAQFGALTMDRKAAKERLKIALEQQKGFIRSALMHRGIEQCNAAQILNGSLLCSVADEEISSIPPASGQVIDMKRVNGAPAESGE
jgi:hypothetical protein